MPVGGRSRLNVRLIAAKPQAPSASRVARLKTFGELIDLHINDMCAVGKAPRRSKAAVLEMLRQRLGRCNMTSLDRERRIAFGWDRAAQGAGPVTLGIDIGMIKLVLSHAAAVHEVPVTIEPINLARIALKRLSGIMHRGWRVQRHPLSGRMIWVLTPIPAVSGAPTRHG